MTILSFISGYIFLSKRAILSPSMAREVHIYHDDEDYRGDHRHMHISVLNRNKRFHSIRRYNEELDDMHEPLRVTVSHSQIEFFYVRNHTYAIRYPQDVRFTHTSDKPIEEFQGPISFTPDGHCVIKNPTVKYDKHTYENKFVSFALPLLPGMKITDLTTDRVICEIPLAPEKEQSTISDLIHSQGRALRS